MEGIVRSLVQEFIPAVSGGEIVVQVPYKQFHCFEVQIFFPFGATYKFKGTSGLIKFVSTPQPNSAGDLLDGYSQPLRFYCDPRYKRSDTWTFVPVNVPGDQAILAIFSYIDKG